MIVYKDVLFMKRPVKNVFFLFHTSRLTFKLKHLSNFPFLCRFYKVCSYHIYIALKLFHSGLKREDTKNKPKAILFSS